MSDEHYESKVRCPACNKRNIQTVVSYNYARGMLLAVRHGKKRFAGCVPCAGGELRKEAGRQLLYGWFSPTALVLTLAYVPWNFGRSFFLKPNKEKVTELFREIGLPGEAAETNATLSLYAAVAAMILADGKIDPNELETARRASARFIPEFDPDRLDEMLKLPALPVAQLGALLKPVLTDESKDALVALLVEIAHGDASFDKREERLLRDLCREIEAPAATVARIGKADAGGAAGD